MAIDLKIVPGKTVTQDEFLQTHPPFSIALDGYVQGQPFLIPTASGPYRNFNHHELVDRSCTCATCEQVRRAVILGLFELYKWPSGPRATIWINDCDQDVCLATWILMNPSRADEPLVRTLTYIEDLLDMSAGAFPIPADPVILGKVRWVFEPYAERRPDMASLDAAGMREIIEAVHERIDKFVRGKGEVIAARGGYEQLGGGRGWVLVEVEHQHARQKMIEAGVNAAVELFARGDDDTYFYSIWRRSEYIVDFPVPEILVELNRTEGFEDEDTKGWGGSDNVGGSPRKVGTKLSPEQVAEVVNGVVDRAFESHNYGEELP
ncbi:MAG: hypothetical protein KJO07_03705 [Deltaproteobacteria bacterium]|nr:hypothetical protein [Deltaproteobacteria bacterium]